MAGVVALVTVLVLLVGVATYTLLAPFLTHRIDAQLTSVSQNGNIERYVTYAQHSDSQPPGAQNIWFGLYQPNGNNVLSVPNDLLIHPLSLTAGDSAKLAAHPGVIRTVTTSDGARLRIIPVKQGYTVGYNPVTQDGVAMVGLSMRDVQVTLSRLVVLEVILGAGAVAVAAGLTAWGVRAGLRPLHRVTRTAQEVTAELGPDGSGLSRRVPDGDAAIEVQQVASSLNTLLQAVETEFSARVASEERMRQFLADASHELRTPLTSIRGYAELSRLQSASGEAAGDSMRRIEVEGTRMSRLVEDLLVLARGDQDSSRQITEISVEELLAEAADVVQAAHPQRPITVEGGAGLTVAGDWDQLLRVLINLTTNAAVHTPAGPIRLTAAGVSGPERPVVQLRVADTGPGLPPEEAGHVFERFWRADKARSRAKGGSGLGMAIVAQLVQAHGGTVRFDSDVQRGTTVTVTLPAAQPAPHYSGVPAGSAYQPDGPSAGRGRPLPPAPDWTPPAAVPGPPGTRQN